LEARQQAAIATTSQLARIILDAHRGPHQKIHPATRSFQAIRIFINRELERLESALPQAAAILEPGGRLAVISFHSLEDRIVKRFMRGARPAQDLHGRVIEPASAGLKVIGRHFPSDAECDANPRARSAVLRVAERLP